MREDKNFKCPDIELDFWLISVLCPGGGWAVTASDWSISLTLIESSRDEVISTNMICY